MARTISKQEATCAFDAVLGTLPEDKETVIVDESGDRIAVVVSPEVFDKLIYDRFWSTVDRIRERNADKDPDTVLNDITAIVEAVRQERYGKRNSTFLDS
jgi:hypothetical protein